jgi:hypothetical protein
MNIELGKLADGGLVIINDSPFNTEIKRVEYYRAQKLISLVYNNKDDDDELMHHELNDVSSELVESSPTIFIVCHGPNTQLHGYDVPLIKVGEIA